MKLATEQGNIRELLERQWPAQTLGVGWLGQAGFVLRIQDMTILIDPYLSDYLSIKYRNHEFPHTRMTPSPINPAEVRGIDLVLCTHRHSDHMDPDSLATLAYHNPNCRFVIPLAERKTAEFLGVPMERTLLVDAGEIHRLADHVQLRVVPASHEELTRNSEGAHHFLGFVIKFPKVCIYHSGDTVIYPGMKEWIGKDSIDLALLPVNGRDSFRKERGIPGNMTFEEAHGLCRSLNIPWLVPHHFEMFDFNTVERIHLERQIEDLHGFPACVLPTTDEFFLFA